MYEVIFGGYFDPVVHILAPCRLSEVDCGSYVDVNYPVFGYRFATREVSRLVSSMVASRQYFRSEALVFVPGCDVVWSIGLAYVSIESFQKNLRAANVEIVDLPAEVEFSSVDVSKIDV